MVPRIIYYLAERRISILIWIPVGGLVATMLIHVFMFFMFEPFRCGNSVFCAPTLAGVYVLSRPWDVVSLIPPRVARPVCVAAVFRQWPLRAFAIAFTVRVVPLCLGH